MGDIWSCHVSAQKRKYLALYLLPHVRMVRLAQGCNNNTNNDPCCRRTSSADKGRRVACMPTVEKPSCSDIVRAHASRLQYQCIVAGTSKLFASGCPEAVLQSNGLFIGMPARLSPHWLGWFATKLACAAVRQLLIFFGCWLDTFL